MNYGSALEAELWVDTVPASTTCLENWIMVVLLLKLSLKASIIFTDTLGVKKKRGRMLIQFDRSIQNAFLRFCFKKKENL